MKMTATASTLLAPLFRRPTLSLSATLWAAVLLGCFLPATARAQAQSGSEYDINRTSSSILFASNGTDADAQYASFQITNTSGVNCDDVWVLITASGPAIVLPTTEDGSQRLNDMCAGTTKTAYFFLHNTQSVSGQDPAPETVTITIYNGEPSAGGTLVNTFVYDLAPQKAIKANPHKLVSASITNLPSSGTLELGQTFTLTITGFTATIGADEIVSFTPASLPTWRADLLQVIQSSYDITVTQGDSTGRNYTAQDELLFASNVGIQKIDFTATFTIQVVDVEPDTPAIVTSPLFYISSGEQNKHSDVTAEAIPLAIPEVKLSIDKIGCALDVVGCDPLNSKIELDFIPNTPDTDEVTYTVTLTNTGTATVEVDDFIDTVCGDGCPITPVFVTGTASVNGGSVGDPGNTLTSPPDTIPFDQDFDGPWTLTPGTSLVLVYTMQYDNWDSSIPGQDNSLDNCVVARVGTTTVGPDCHDLIGGGNLPVELAAFDAQVDGRSATLRWSTMSETNNAGFEVQHRYADATGAFEMMGFVAGAGTTEQARAYSFRLDELAPGLHVFRLKQVDYDGTFEYSPEIEVSVEMPDAFLVSDVYPNPFNPQATFSFGVRQRQEVVVEVFNMLGQRVLELYRGTPEAGVTQSLTIDGSALRSGAYVLRVQGERFTDTQLITLLK